MSVAYVDSSVLAAIAFGERDGPALARRLDGFSRLLAANLLESELRAACARERLGFSRELFANLTWVFPDRSLAPEIDAVLSAGYLHGADLWHVACALYVTVDPGDTWFLTLDERQRVVAATLGFRA
jgi:hypothetical protein